MSLFMNRGIRLTLLCGLAALSSWAATYDPAADFGASNPSGAWAYGYAAPSGINSLDAAFTPMSAFTANCAAGVGGSADCWSQGNASISKPTGSFDTGTVNFVSGYLNMHPGSDLNLAVLAFIAPVAANYTFEGEFADHDVVGGSGTDVAAVLGDGTYGVPFTTMTAVSLPVTINFSRALSAGERVYFVVGANGEYSYDSIGLQLTVNDDIESAGVPEPSSVILTGLGAAAVGLLRRRR
jgi:hypothetical protein